MFSLSEYSRRKYWWMQPTNQPSIAWNANDLITRKYFNNAIMIIDFINYIWLWNLSDVVFYNVLNASSTRKASSPCGRTSPTIRGVAGSSTSTKGCDSSNSTNTGSRWCVPDDDWFFIFDWEFLIGCKAIIYANDICLKSINGMWLARQQMLIAWDWLVYQADISLVKPL